MNGNTVLTRPHIAKAFQFAIFSLGGSCAAMMAGALPVAPIKAPVAAPIHMPQGAFLRAPSPDVAHLVAQVKADPRVAVRYARLFHLPVKMVPLAFAQLHLKKLTNDHIMQVHFVRQGDKVEKLIYKPRRVMAGTPVYCLPDGTPLLVRVCGNPIRSRVSPEFYSNIPVPEFDASETLTPVPTADSSTAANGPGRVVITPPLALLEPIPVVDAESVLPPTALPVAPSLPPEGLKIASLPPVYAWAGGPTGLFGLAGLPLALIPFIHTGGGNAPSVAALIPPVVAPIVPGGTLPLPTPITPIGPTGGPITDVPEPGLISLGATLLLLGAGGLVRRRRSRHAAR